MSSAANIDDPRYVKALSHPLRVRILALLQERRATPVELSGWLSARLGTVAYHVRTLHQLGLVELVEETRVRGAVAHHYRATERPRVSDAAWEQASPMAKQAAVGAALQTIDEYARASAAAGGFDAKDAHITRTNLRLDQEGWQQASQAAQRLLDELAEIEGETRRRLAEDPHAGEPVDASLVVLFFEAVRLSETVGSDAGDEHHRRSTAEPAARA